MACDQSRGWTLHEGELGRADVRALLDLHFNAMRAGSPPSACHVLAADELEDPGIRFFSVREAGVLLGVGALKALAPGHSEIKSMRTDRAALGRGVGAFLLDRLLDVARDRGDDRVSLETGNSPEFAAAIRLYERSGFERCGPFADYAPTAFTLFYTRRL